MSFYLERAIRAKALLTRRGKTITLYRITGESTDPVTGIVTGGVPDNQTTVGVIKPYKKKLIDGKLIQTGDKEAIIAYDVQPLHTDKLENMQIVNITEIKPADQVILYRLQVRS